MLTVFDRPDSAKELYFKLNNSLHLADPLFSPTYKIAGLYAIFKNDVCYYVGQSKNLPSRIATHLTGKYKSCDRVDIYFVCKESYEDFYSRTKSIQTAILENNETRLIQLKSPIENLMVDNDKAIPKEHLFYCLTEPDIDPCLSILTSENYTITVLDCWDHSFLEANKEVQDSYLEMLKMLGRI